MVANSKADGSSNRTKNPTSVSGGDEGRDAELAAFLLEVMQRNDNTVVVAAIQRQIMAMQAEKESRNDDDNAQGGRFDPKAKIASTADCNLILNKAAQAAAESVTTPRAHNLPRYFACSSCSYIYDIFESSFLAKMKATGVCPSPKSKFYR